MRKINVFGAIILLFTGINLGFSQVKMPAPSPLSTVTQNIGLIEASVTYSRPSVKGREIFGELVPYDKLWRTGANASTKVAFSDEVMVEGIKVPAGTYSLLTIPGKKEWTIILNKNTEMWGVSGYEEAQDVARFKVNASDMKKDLETFTINFSDLSYNSADIKMAWANTMVKFRVETDVDSKVMASIKETLATEAKAGDYLNAATFYYDTKRDMDQALEWINKAIEMYEQENRNIYWVYHRKAKILAALDQYDKAIDIAQKSMEKAKEANNPDYVRLNEKLINEWKKKV